MLTKPPSSASAARIGICMLLLGCGGAEPGSGGGGASPSGGSQGGGSQSGGSQSGGSPSGGGGGTTNAASTAGAHAGDIGSGGSGLGVAGNVAGDAAAGGGAAGHGGGGTATDAGSGGGGTNGTAGKTGEGGNAGSASHPGDAVEFQGHFYRFTQASISGASAEAICEGLGGYLACIETENENVFLLTLAGTARPWFGLNNLANQKVWVWINGSPTTYEHWQPGQPDNPANEHWGKMLETGFWDDGSIETSYMCEWDR